MRVHIPTALRSYTGRCSEVSATGGTLGALLDDLERQFPGLRFRIIDEQDGVRPHIKLFVDGEQTRSLDVALRADAEIAIVMALSGGASCDPTSTAR